MQWSVLLSLVSPALSMVPTLLMCYGVFCVYGVGGTYDVYICYGVVVDITCVANGIGMLRLLILWVLLGVFMLLMLPMPSNVLMLRVVFVLLMLFMRLIASVVLWYWCQ